MNRYYMLINGELTAGDMALPVINPATEDVIAMSPRASERQFNEAVEAAKQAYPAWSATSMTERKALLGRMADTIERNLDELARLVTLEQGKPLEAAMGETAATAWFTRHFATMDLPAQSRDGSPGHAVQLLRRPLGVVAAILPWNFPLALFSLKVAPALLAGNTVVAKPAPTTPLSTLRLVELCKDILPPGVLNVVVDNNDLGNVLTAHPDVRKISFTGSTTTGKKVMASAASTVKRITLELGGNDPAIVLADCDPKAIAQTLFNLAFFNSGQVCLAIKRLYVHESIYDEMCGELARIASVAVVDEGMKPGTQLGPVQNRMQYEKLKELLAVAPSEGKVIAGGIALDRPGYFIAPTIVSGIKQGARLVEEEQFGPILPIISYSNLDDVVDSANDTPYGLGASVWSNDIELAKQVAGRIEAGTVWINNHNDCHPAVPFGGCKQSGIGVELGEEGLAEFTRLQVISARAIA